MNSKVHGVIVRAIKNVIEPWVLEILYTSIDQDAWKKVRTELKLDENSDNPEVYDNAKNYFDVLCLGAIDEDNTKLLSDIDDPDAEACSMGKILVKQKGKHQHWLEHFWNDSLKDDRDKKSKQGFSINHKYISDVVSEITGVNYLQTFGNFGGIKLGTMSNEATTCLVEAFIAMFYGENLYDSYYSAPNRAERYWKKALEQYKNKEYERAFYNLGKVCHLLADVGTPAHVHNDGHMGVNWLETVLKEVLKIDTDCPDFFKVDDDKYEATTGKVIEENLKTLDNERADEALPQKWQLKDKGCVYYVPEWNLFKYFHSLGELTKRYDSDDADGKGGKPFHWEHFDLLNIDSYTHSAERCENDDLTEYACYQIAQDLIPLSIAHTAGILYLFFNSVDVSGDVTYPQTYKVAAKKIHIHDDEDCCLGGEIYFTLEANDHPKRLPKISAKSGDLKTLNGQWSCEVTTPADPEKGGIFIHTEAEDNDDWTIPLIGTIHKAKDPLGVTNCFIKISDIDESNQPIEFSLTSSNNDYTVYLSVKKGETEKKQHNLRRALKEISSTKKMKLKTSKYKEGSTIDMQPLLLNLDSLHFHCNTTSNKDCKIWRNASGQKIKAYMFDSEISKFRKISPKNSINLLQGLMNHVDKVLSQNANKQKFIKYVNDYLHSTTITEKDIKDFTKEVLNTIDNPKFKNYINEEEQKTNIFCCLPNLSKEAKEYLHTVTMNNFYNKFSASCSCCKDKKTQKYLDFRRKCFDK
jgi:hypothetical protein